MNHEFLLAESGSSKTNWSWYKSGLPVLEWCTEGINPYYLETEHLKLKLMQVLPDEVLQIQDLSIYFYGAGCSDDTTCQKMRFAFEQVCGLGTRVLVESDMLAAARSLCGISAGVVGILGTGSNSCVYDGHKIIENGLGLGFVLGDEGAGSWLGLNLLSDFFGQRMPEDLAVIFTEKFSINRGQILENIYSKPYPNRFLAGFAPFISHNIAHIYCRQLVCRGFGLFIDNCIGLHKTSKHLPIHFTGSIAAVFAHLLIELLISKDLKHGNIVANPFDLLKIWHETHSFQIL